MPFFLNVFTFFIPIFDDILCDALFPISEYEYIDLSPITSIAYRLHISAASVAYPLLQNDVMIRNPISGFQTTCRDGVLPDSAFRHPEFSGWYKEIDERDFPHTANSAP
jgi:hypothetical protein